MTKRLKIVLQPSGIWFNKFSKSSSSSSFTSSVKGWDPVLQWRSPNFVYQPVGTKNIKLLLKNYKLSDDIAFRFSNKSWAEHPLTATKFARWVNAINGDGEVVNLFRIARDRGEDLTRALELTPYVV